MSNIYIQEPPTNGKVFSFCYQYFLSLGCLLHYGKIVPINFSFNGFTPTNPRMPKWGSRGSALHKSVAEIIGAWWAQVPPLAFSSENWGFRWIIDKRLTCRKPTHDIPTMPPRQKCSNCPVIFPTKRLPSPIYNAGFRLENDNKCMLERKWCNPSLATYSSSFTTLFGGGGGGFCLLELGK